ncbi:hypothetical protein QJS10_CPB11g00526 [Acorus calamus]|uniref:HMA domain-containing protein n=1 Tax=Acorus calamus TaxID=4465 RepID=A0AAV9DTJ3_ACOCL|nr:hypothetical protein QJS10_CPB11g00526 [Acorus calamus]
MGEAKQEEAKAEANPEAKPEEKKEETKKEEKTEEKKEEKAEEKKEEEPKPPSPPPPTVLHVDLHCVGCAKKIERTILKVRGVEEVETNIMLNQVTVKGIVDPQAICARIQKRTSRTARILSPLPPAEGESKPEEAPPAQMSGMQKVELEVNMHCEACAQQLQKKILKMRGVQTVETDLNSGKVMVTGTMDAEKLKDYIYRRTRKVAKIVPPPPKEEPKKEEEAKPTEEKPAEEKKEEKAEEKKEEEKPETPPQDGDKGGDGGGGEETAPEKGEEPKKEGEEVVVTDDMVKKMMYWRPIYVIEQLPPPQLFSDENPNACCIS